MDYEIDIIIDENALDVEFLNQPMLFMKYSCHAARMARELDEEKQNLDIAKAEVDRDIRENPSNYKIEKVTEGSITSVIFTSKKYQDAYKKKYLDAKFEYDMAQSAVRAFDQRKTTLENLVRLHGQQYFAGPRVPHDISQQRKEKNERVKRENEANDKVASKIQRRK